jgi:hypothetical protein
VSQREARYVTRKFDVTNILCRWRRAMALAMNKGHYHLGGTASAVMRLYVGLPLLRMISGSIEQSFV